MKLSLPNNNNGFLVGLLLLFSLAAFLPCLNNGFTWDDFTYIRDNASIQHLSWPNLKEIFTTSLNGSYHPLTQLSFALEYHWVQSNPWLYHLDNVLLHSLNTVLVFVLIRLLSTGEIAFITALLFSLHPLRVESVAWIAERKDVLFACFYLAALIQYIRRRLWACLGLFILAVLAKPQAASLPMVLLSLDYLVQRQWSMAWLKEKTLFFLISLASIGGGILGGTNLMLSHHILGGNAYLSIIDKVLFSCYAVVLYMYQCLLPLKLSIIYFYPLKINGLWPWLVYLAPMLIVLGLIILYRLRLPRPIIWALAFFCLTIALPLSNIWMGGNLMADRYTYLPGIGIAFITASVGLASYKNSLPVKRLIFIYVGWFFISSFLRCDLWKDYLTMTSAIIQEHPDADTYNLRGEILFENGKFNEALADFNRTIALAPNHAPAYYNRGYIHLLRKDYTKALADYSMAIQLDPTNANAYNNRGQIYSIFADLPSSIADLKKSLTLMPDDAQVLNNLKAAQQRSNLNK